MKVVFLDVDGVLNDMATILSTGRDFPTKDHLDCLKQIIDATDAKIVLSSSWRFHAQDRNDIKNALRNVGLEIFDMTKELSMKHQRGEEIKEWLSRHPEVERFVILDDHEEDILPVYPNNIVKTTLYEGLQERHVNPAIKILKGE